MSDVVDTYNQWMLEGVYYTDQLPAYQNMVQNLIQRLDIASLTNSDTVMDLGSGLGFTSRMIREVNQDVKIIAVDPSKEMLTGLEQKSDLKIDYFLNCRAEEIGQFWQEPVRVILAAFSLHHVPHEHKINVLKQLNALLPIGGRLGIGEISVDTRQIDPLKKFEDTVDFFAFGSRYIARATHSVANGIQELRFLMQVLHGGHEHFLLDQQWRELFEQVKFTVPESYFSQPEDLKYFNLIGEKINS